MYDPRGTRWHIHITPPSVTNRPYALREGQGQVRNQKRQFSGDPLRLAQDVFAKSVDGMGLQTLEAGERELNRLRKLKLEKMGELVLASRAKIRGMHTAGTREGVVFVDADDSFLFLFGPLDFATKSDMCIFGEGLPCQRNVERAAATALRPDRSNEILTAMPKLKAFIFAVVPIYVILP